MIAALPPGRRRRAAAAHSAVLVPAARPPHPCCCRGSRPQRNASPGGNHTPAALPAPRLLLARTTPVASSAAVLLHWPMRPKLPTASASHPTHWADPVLRCAVRRRAPAPLPSARRPHISPGAVCAAIPPNASGFSTSFRAQAGTAFLNSRQPGPNRQPRVSPPSRRPCPWGHNR